MKTKIDHKNANKTDEVDAYMRQLVHPLKKEIEATRNIIKKASSKIFERVKWNAPSFFYQVDIVTFNHRATDHVHLVFHHPAIETIKSFLLVGEYKGRRMMYLQNMEEVKSAESELKRILNEVIMITEATTKPSKDN